MEGERPARPHEQDLTHPVWDTTVRCWQEDPVLRPRMEKVVTILRRRGVSLSSCTTWKPQRTSVSCSHGLPVLAAQQSGALGSSVLSDLGYVHRIFTRLTAWTFYTSQQESVAPGFGMRLPTVGPSEKSLPDPINQPGAISTSQEQAAKLPGKVSLQCLNIVYSPPSKSSTWYKVTFEYGPVDYKTSMTNFSTSGDQKEWCAHAHLYLPPAAKSHPGRPRKSF